MKARIIFCIFFCYIYYICAMQQQVIRIHHSRESSQESALDCSPSPEIIIIEMHEDQATPQQEIVEYRHNKKLACIGLVTALIGAGTAITIYLTK